MFEFLRKSFARFAKKTGEVKAEERKPGLFEIKLSKEQFDKIFSSLELELLQNNVAYSVVDKVKESLKKDLVSKAISRKELARRIRGDLKKLILDIFQKPAPVDIFKFIWNKKRKDEFITLLFVGPNGHGKTTTLAKLAYLLKKKGYKCVLAAGDTFRSAAIEQLQAHADKLEIRLVKHKYGADPAAVAYDAVRVKGKDVVLIDTAGRSHADINLLDEMRKIKRVAKPDLVLFVGESIAGNDCVEQVKRFHEAVGVDGVILTKVDVDEKGGTLISVVQTINKPILFLGVGQRYEDLEEFDVWKVISKIL